MKNIAFIPVRGGSKSIPLKNIMSLAGQPLLHWSLKAALDCPQIDQVVIATDSDEIESCAREIKSPQIVIYRRSAKNAQDKSSTESVMLEYLESRGDLESKDLFVLIQATNPFITAEHLTKAFKKMKASKANSLLSGVRTKRFFWSENAKPVNYDFKKRPRRQDFDGLLMENGAFYISSVGDIKKSKNRLSGKIALYEMPEASGFEIDEPEDWTICEALLLRQHSFKAKGPRDFSKVKLFLTDVDGVLTDAGMYYSENGDALKKFNTLDGMGIRQLMESGIPVGIITGENTPIVAKRAEKLKITILKQGIQDKLPVAKEIVKSLGLTLDQVAYIGDDVNDLELLSAVGFAACPATAVTQIRSIPDILKLTRKGGEGVVREYIEMILKDL